MSEPVSFDALLAALRDSVTGARESLGSAAQSGPHVEELTMSFEGTLYESSSGLGMRLGQRRSWRRQTRRRVQIRLHGEPIVTDVSMDGYSFHDAAKPSVAGETR